MQRYIIFRDIPDIPSPRDSGIPQDSRIPGYSGILSYFGIAGYSRIFQDSEIFRDIPESMWRKSFRDIVEYWVIPKFQDIPGFRDIPGYSEVDLAKRSRGGRSIPPPPLQRVGRG